MENVIGQARRARASRLSRVRQTGSPRSPRFAASAILLLAAAIGACSDDSNPMTQTQNENPAPGPTTMPGAMTPPNTMPGNEGSTEPSNPPANSNEGSGEGMIPLEPGAMAGEGGGTPPGNTPPDESEGNSSEEMPPAGEMPPVVEPPPEEPTAFNPCPTDGSPCRIMPLGDSITDGLVGMAPGNTQASNGGYRVELFRQAVADGHAITFVGRQANGPNNVDGQQFPRNHEGYSGATIATGGNQLADRVEAALAANPPDIVLLHIGTNNLYNGMAPTVPDQLGDLLDQITDSAPDALVVVAQITPLGASFGNSGVDEYNAALPAIVQTRVDAGKHLITVDMFSAITDSGMPVAQLVGDTIHPNAQGYAIMAETWYEAIENVLP